MSALQGWFWERSEETKERPRTHSGHGSDRHPNKGCIPLPLQFSTYHPHSFHLRPVSRLHQETTRCREQIQGDLQVEMQVGAQGDMQMEAQVGARWSTGGSTGACSGGSRVIRAQVDGQVRAEVRA